MESFQLPSVIQEISLPANIDNKTLPGVYILNLTIDSEYYYGSIEQFIKVKQKMLDITLNYESKVDEDEGFDITWDLEHGNFTGNRENMTMEIYLYGLKMGNDVTPDLVYRGIYALALTLRNIM